MKNTTPTRVLPADVFDALELSAHIFKGIGSCRTRDSKNNPHCVAGHADFLDACDGFKWGPVGRALQRAFNGNLIHANDYFVRKTLIQQNKSSDGRITFREWCKGLNVIRGK